MMRHTVGVTSIIMSNELSCGVYTTRMSAAMALYLIVRGTMPFPLLGGRGLNHYPTQPLTAEPGYVLFYNDRYMMSPSPLSSNDRIYGTPHGVILVKRLMA